MCRGEDCRQQRTFRAASMTLWRLGPSVSLMSNRTLAPLGTALKTLGWMCQVPVVATLSLLPAAGLTVGGAVSGVASEASLIRWTCACGAVLLCACDQHHGMHGCKGQAPAPQ